MNSDQVNIMGMSEDDLIMLESMVKSPVWGAFKKAIGSYRKSIQSQLLTGNEMSDIHRNQGRIISLDAVEQLPVLLVSRHQAKQKKAEEQENAFKNLGPKPKTK